MARSSALCSWVAMRWSTAPYSRSLRGKWCSRDAVGMPSALATSRTLVPWKPEPANNDSAASRIWLRARSPLGVLRMPKKPDDCTVLLLLRQYGIARPGISGPHQRVDEAGGARGQRYRTDL